MTDLENNIKQQKNDEFSIRVGAIAFINVLWAIGIDLVNIFYQNDKVGLFSALILICFIFFLLHVKWVVRFKNKKNLKNVLEFGTIISILVFLLEKTFLPFIEDNSDKITIFITFITLIVGMVAIMFMMLKKHKEDDHT